MSVALVVGTVAVFISTVIVLTAILRYESHPVEDPSRRPDAAPRPDGRANPRSGGRPT